MTAAWWRDCRNRSFQLNRCRRWGRPNNERKMDLMDGCVTDSIDYLVTGGKHVLFQQIYLGYYLEAILAAGSPMSAKTTWADT